MLSPSQQRRYTDMVSFTVFSACFRAAGSRSRSAQPSARTNVYVLLAPRSHLPQHVAAAARGAEEILAERRVAAEEEEEEADEDAAALEEPRRRHRRELAGEEALQEEGDEVALAVGRHDGHAQQLLQQREVGYASAARCDRTRRLQAEREQRLAARAEVQQVVDAVVAPRCAAVALAQLVEGEVEHVEEVLRVLRSPLRSTPTACSSARFEAMMGRAISSFSSSLAYGSSSRTSSRIWA